MSPSNIVQDYELYYNARLHQCFYPYDAFYTILSPESDGKFRTGRPLVQRLDKAKDERASVNRDIFMIRAKPHDFDQLPNYITWRLNIELKELESGLKRKIRDLKDSLFKTLNAPEGSIVNIKSDFQEEISQSLRDGPC